MLEPDEGRVFDPCCGSGGMFVQSEKFVESRQGRLDDISIYGQESNRTTWRLCKMNLAIRGIDSSQVAWNNEGSFLKDAHKDLKSDFIIANPPFNVSDWSGELLRKDARWVYGTPPKGNANFGWVQHFLHHLRPGGQAGFVLSKGALTSKTGGEGDIRQKLIEEGLVDCIVNLPAKLFLNTQIPASLWFLSRPSAAIETHGRASQRGNGRASQRGNGRASQRGNGRASQRGNGRASQRGNGRSSLRDYILFIDARDLGELINRRTRVLADEDIALIADTYHLWKKGEAEESEEKVSLESWQTQLAAEPTTDYNLKYQDIPGFCKSEKIERVAELDYVLTPGRFVGLPEEEDDFDFEERFTDLKGEFEKQLKEEERLNQQIQENLSRIEMPKE